MLRDPAQICTIVRGNVCCRSSTGRSRRHCRAAGRKWPLLMVRSTVWLSREPTQTWRWYVQPSASPFFAAACVNCWSNVLCVLGDSRGVSEGLHSARAANTTIQPAEGENRSATDARVTNHTFQQKMYHYNQDADSCIRTCHMAVCVGKLRVHMFSKKFWE
jgi:hypothetical protein